MLQSLFHFLTRDPYGNSLGNSALIAQYCFGELKAARVFKSGASNVFEVSEPSRSGQRGTYRLLKDWQGEARGSFSRYHLR
ncbi:MAG: hypothetical protein V7L02_11870 [Nostoc sp.]